ncbi:MAG: hypothetical protein JKY19_05915 [Alcanivoracaceae bacterium]|nr:hypothetical protein [Alcanivoracaceae bacterium]
MKKTNHMISLIMIMMFSVNSVNAAVSLNQKGIGQVLIFPYYTVNNDINTLISITNTTDKVKALKIRFLEGKNNRDTLIFNIYLGPHDIWTGALVSTNSTIQGHEGEDSVKLITNDASCTVPTNITGQEFLPFALEGEFADGIDANMSRVTEGQIHIFEMGNVVADFADLASPGHENFDCQALQSNWLTPSGAWTLDTTQNMTAPDGSGGLFGSVSLIDVADGFDVSYNADAIQGYSHVIQHETPASPLPSLNSGSTSESVYTGQLVTIIPWDHPFQAISSLFMMNNLYSEYILDGGIGANTEWVTSFPTKSYYVDPAFAPEAVPMAPFTAALDTTGACESAQIELYNRETGINIAGQDTIDLCWGTNIFEFTKELDGNETSLLLGSNNATAITTSSDTGWLNLEFNQAVTTMDVSVNNNPRSITINGLPMAGFAMQRYVNGNLEGGILANYAGLFTHKGSSEISIISPAQ